MRTAFWLNVAVKASLILLLAFGTFSGLERFAGKAFGWRLLGYSIAAFIVPAIWAARGRRSSYPYASDILFVLPFLIDTIGNALDLYDTIDWWDDANHLVNWFLHTAAIGLLLRRTTLPAPARAGIAVGWAATTAILWELAEYVAFVPGSAEASTAYADTLGDLALGLLGGTIAAVASAWWPRDSLADDAAPADGAGPAVLPVS